MLKRFVLFAVISLLALVACQPTGDRSTDTAAAQSFFPAIPNYTVQESADLQSAMSNTLAAASVATGNLVAAPLILKIDEIIACYREVGAFDARLYVENPGDQLIRDGIRLPIGGVLIVVNQTRAASNLAPCFSRASGMRAQVATPEPCTGNGTFTYEGDTIAYYFAATDAPLCDTFNQHFAQYGS
jgi:hypothetical protein